MRDRGIVSAGGWRGGPGRPHVQDGRVSPVTPEEATAQFCDAVNLWRISAASSGEVIDAAVACLVAAVDSPTLRELAGASPRDSQFELEPLIESTLQELGLEHILAVSPQRGALVAMIRRFKNGEFSARELARWAHTYIGHDGDESCQVFVDLDDFYDAADYSDYGAEDRKTLMDRPRKRLTPSSREDPHPLARRSGKRRKTSRLRS